jgi:saposin
MKIILCIALFVAIVSCVPVAPKLPKSDCDICQTLISAIENWVEDNKTETQIIEDFETLCYLVPLWTTVCDQVVVYGVDEVIKYIQNDQPPSVVCAEIGICSAKKVHKPKPKPKSRDENCFLCETVIETIEDWVESNATEQQIEANLEALCALVPGFEAQCDAIVQQGVPQVVQWIQKNESPTQVCDQLGFCNATLKFKFHKKPVKLNKAVFRSKAKNPKDLQCTICEGIISAM